MGLGKGPWVVELALEQSEADERKVGRWHGEATKVEAPAERLEIELQAPVRLFGTVVDSRGEPVTSFIIAGERAGTQWYMPPTDEEIDTFASEDGSFTLQGLRPGTWTFTAKSDGMIAEADLTLTLPDEAPQRLVLMREIAISGQVVNPSGEPVVGAEVGPELEGVELVAGMQGRGDYPKANTDEEGRFLLKGLTPGAGSIVGKGDGFAASEALSYELGEGESLDDVRLTLRVGGTIGGEVYDKDGNLAKGCMVIIQLSTMAERRFTNADSNGQFEEGGLMPGTYQVQAFPGIESISGTADQATLIAALKMTTVKLEDGGSEHVVLGAPPADPVHVQGRVTADGEPLEGMIVSFMPTSGGGADSLKICLLYTSPSPRDRTRSRMPSSA